MNVIVVGVDHSPGAQAALVFAEEEARLRGATLRAVHAWQYGYIGYTGLEGGMPVLGGDMNELHAAAEAALAASVREALPDSAVEIEQRAIQGVAAGVLVDESRERCLPSRQRERVATTVDDTHRPIPLLAWRARSRPGTRHGERTAG